MGSFQKKKNEWDWATGYTGEPIYLSPHASVKNSTRRSLPGPGRGSRYSRPVPFQKTVRNPDYHDRRPGGAPCFAVVLASVLLGNSLFAVYWTRVNVTRRTGGNGDNFVQRYRGLYTLHRCMGATGPKAQKIRRDDEPFSHSVSEGGTLGVRSAIRAWSQTLRFPQGLV